MRIRISNQGEPSRIESFEHKTEVKIGRVPANDLVLAERGISSNHARLHIDHNHQLYIEDLGSTNGTFVNGQRIQGTRQITLQDEVYVCHIKIEVAADNQQFPPEPEQAPVQTGSTQMATPEQAEALRVGRKSGSLSGEIGGGDGGYDQGQWNQGGYNQQQGQGQGQWNGGGQWNQAQPNHDPQGQWGQAQQGADAGQWNQGQGQWDQAQQGHDQQGQWDQQGYNQQGYDQQGYNQQGYDQQGYNQQGYDQQGHGQHGQHGQWNQQGYAEPSHEAAVEEVEEFEEVEEVEELEEIQEVEEFEAESVYDPEPESVYEPEYEPEPEPAPRVAVERSRGGPPRPTEGPAPVTPSRHGRGRGGDELPDMRGASAGLPAMDAGPPVMSDPSDAGPPSFDSGPPGFDSGPPGFDSGPPGFDSGPPSFDSGPPSFDSGPSSFDSGPPGLDSGPPGLDSGPPGLDSGPPGLDSGPRGLDSGPRGLNAGPPGLDAGPPGLDGGPPGLGAGPPSFNGGPPGLDGPPGLSDLAGPGPASLGGPPSLGAGPPALSLDAGPPSLGMDGGGGPPSLGAGLGAGPPALSGPPSLSGPAGLSGPPSLGPEPDDYSSATVVEAPESSAPSAAPRSAGSASSAATSSPWRQPEEEELDMRPEYAVRAAVFYELLSDLGVTPEHPPDDGEKQRKAARVGAKRRLAVSARNDPDLMLDEPSVEAEHLLAEVFALGPLTGVLDDENAREQVREVIIRSPQRIYVDRGNGRERLERGFSCPAAIAMALHRFAGAHLQWDAAAPWLDHRMPDGTRLRGADISVAPDGPVVVIRRPARAVTGGLSQVGAVSHPIAEYLRAVLCAGGSVLVCIGDGCEGTELLSALAHELARFDVAELGIVRAGSRIVPPRGALVLDAEPGLTAGPINLAIQAGSTRLLIHRAGGAGLASAWAGLSGEVEQVVLGLGVSDPEAGLASCVEGLVLGGFGRDRDALRHHVAASISVVVVIGRSSRGAESPVTLAEFDAQGAVSLILSRDSADAKWQHHGDPAFMAELARRGVTFDALKLAELAQAQSSAPTGS